MCNKFKIFNPERFHIREALKAFFIYSVYNNGKVNEIHKSYPKNLKSFFNQYDQLFTTNYDSNVEQFTGSKVYYLHGSFDIKKDVYDPDSFRNKLSDSPINNSIVDEEFYYLYSNVLTTFNGYYKMFSINQSTNANTSIEKMTQAYKTNLKIRKEIDSWKNDANELIRKMAESVELKLEDNNLEFKETYPIKEFLNLSGDVDIVGLSPNNDTHLFQILNENENLNTITYYYFDSNEIDMVNKLLFRYNLDYKDVKSLWGFYNKGDKFD